MTKDVFGKVAPETKVVKISKMLDEMTVAKDRFLNAHHIFVIFLAGGVAA